MTVRLAQDVGMDVVARYAERFGVYDDMQPFLANALGSQETTLYRMVAAYAMFANGGERVEPTLVDRVQDRYGRTVYRHDQRLCPDCELASLDPGMGPRIVSNRERVIDPVTAYQLTSMMQGVVQRGTAAGTVGGGHSRRAGRQDRHHERRARRVVRRLLLDHRGGLLHRLRPAPQPRARRLGRRHVRPGLRRVHARGGAGIRRRALRGAAGRRVLPDRPLFRPAPAAGQRGEHVVYELFREGEAPFEGLLAVIDGGWGMGSDLPMFGRGEGGDVDAASIQPGAATTAREETTVRTSDGRHGAGAHRHRLRHAQRGRALLSAFGRLLLEGPRRIVYLSRNREQGAGVMRAETQGHIEKIRKSLELLGQRMGLETAQHRLEEFNARVEDPDLWNDPERAQKLMRERQLLVDQIGTYEAIKSGLNDNSELIELGEMEGDAEVVAEAEAALADLVETAAAKELEALLDGEADANDTFLEVNAGAGGTESCDWAGMLARMYTRWAEKRGYEVELQSVSYGEEAGIKSAVYKISGHNAYGWLKSESGVHRLVRISPYDSAARRHTSFSSVWVYPVVDDNIEIEVNPADIRIDTYRSSGAGGQHVNTTDSAVRITHNPTGIVVTSEKSQHQNRDIAMKALKSRLYQLELEKRTASIQEAHEAKGEAGWGNQIRSYVLQPYQMVKDLRTNYETSDTGGVLDGDLDGLMAATLAMNASGKTRAEARAEG
jgi:peptide chain release factor 2